MLWYMMTWQACQEDALQESVGSSGEAHLLMLGFDKASRRNDMLVEIATRMPTVDRWFRVLELSSSSVNQGGQLITVCLLEEAPCGGPPPGSLGVLPAGWTRHGHGLP